MAQMTAAGTALAVSDWLITNAFVEIFLAAMTVQER